jgi:hypothetical protein
LIEAYLYNSFTIEGKNVSLTEGKEKGPEESK